MEFPRRISIPIGSGELSRTEIRSLWNFGRDNCMLGATVTCLGRPTSAGPEFRECARRMISATTILSMVAAICFTLAGIQLLAWMQMRSSRDSLLFSIAALAAAATALLELSLLHTTTPEAYGAVVRWLHLPVTVLTVSIAWFLRVYLNAGRTWLVWLITALRTLVLAMNFVVMPNATFTEISGLNQIDFLGESVSVPLGVQSPWRLVTLLSTTLLVVHAIDASLMARRRGTFRRPLLLGGAVAFAAVLGYVFANLMTRGVLPAPFLSIMFLLIVLAMAIELGADLSRTRKLAYDLHASRERMRLAARAANLGLWEWDIGRDRIWSSRYGLENDEGSYPERMTFDSYLQTVHVDDRASVTRAFDRALGGDGEVNVEFRVGPRDGQVRWIVVHGGELERDPFGRPLRLRGVSLDITEHKRITAELQRQRAQLSHIQRVYALDQLSAALAHEINQPLGAILRNVDAAELLLRNNPTDLDEIRAIIADIKRDEQRAASVIQRLGTLMKRRELTVEALTVTDLIEPIVELLRGETEARPTTLLVEIPPGLPRISGDRVHLQQVVLNLMLNGLEAQDDGRREQRLLEVVASRPRRGTVEVAVIDRGKGIPEEQLPHLFEPFQTSKSSGIGIGLAISKTIVELHGGRIWGENNPEGGATFRFTLRTAEMVGES